MKILLILIGCILAAVAAGFVISAYIIAQRLANGLNYWKLPANSESNVVPIRKEKTHCNYPECYCPLDAPYDPDGTWCAIGLPKEPRS